MIKRDVKCSRSTAELRRELVILSEFDVGGIRGVAVKCLDITKNSDCEGSQQGLFRCGRNSWCSGEMLRYHEELRLRRQPTRPLLTLKLEGAGIEQD